MAENPAKKEQKKRKAQEKKAKAERADKRKQNSDKGRSLEDMFVYVDEYGNLTSVPTDPSQRKEVELEDIVFQTGSRDDSAEPADAPRNGKIDYFSQAKGFGFIIDAQTGDRIFVHASELPGPVNENDKVTFFKDKNARGFFATNVVIKQS